MTLFTLLIVMALERVVIKSKALHITSLARIFFGYVNRFLHIIPTQNDQKSASLLVTLLAVAALPAVAVAVLVSYLPAALVFFLYILLLWICLGCPITRDTYKRYLQAATRKDYEACLLYSQQFGNEDHDLCNVGEQLVLVNYRQYASVIIFFILLGLPGMVFYSLYKEWYSLINENAATFRNANKASIIMSDNVENDAPTINNIDNSPLNEELCSTSEDNISIEHENMRIQVQKVLFFIDWLPCRITAFGFLVVGHFSRGLPVWLSTFTHSQLSAYEVLAKVAKASEDAPSLELPELHEPLQMVSLAKRNIIFLLMVISLLTLAGMLS